MLSWSRLWIIVLRCWTRINLAKIIRMSQKEYKVMFTTDGPRRVVLPLQPRVGDVIVLERIGKNDLIVVSNKKIMGLNEDLVLDVDGMVELLYTSEKNG